MHTASNRPYPPCTGILYSAMPRGDMAGTVLFTDRTNRLCCEIQFGEIKVYECARTLPAACRLIAAADISAVVQLSCKLDLMQ